MDQSHGQVDALLGLLARQAPDHAFMFLDLEGRITWWSPAAGKIFGYAPQEIVGQPSALLFVPEDVKAGMPQYEMKAAASTGMGEDDRWMLRRDGTVFWATGVLVALRDAVGTLLGYGKILRNRTDLKEQLEALRNLARELEAAGRRRDAFLGTLSHELRNPLAPIANAVGIIRAGLKEMPPEVAFALRVVERQMSLIERLVEDLMDVTRVSVGKMDLRIAPLAVQDLVREVAADVGERIGKRRQRLEVVLPDAPIQVRGDRDRLHQVIANLLVNASKYTPEGGRIWVKATTEGEEAVIKVEDDGAGIPAEMLPRIFDLFTQVESTREAAQGGLGIGLALVKNIVSLHGGSVQARSDGPGKGSEFAVRLQLARAAP